MQVTAPTANAATTLTASPVVQKTLGQDDFLKLLATQLAAQDPMAPTDSTAFVAQMASFSSLQQMSMLNTNFTSFSKGQDANSAPQYLGKQITATDAAGNAVTGIATAVQIQAGAATVTINGSDYPLGAITTVALPTT